MTSGMGDRARTGHMDAHDIESSFICLYPGRLPLNSSYVLAQYARQPLNICLESENMYQKSFVSFIFIYMKWITKYYDFSLIIYNYPIILSLMRGVESERL